MILYHSWTLLPMSLRIKIAEQFGIKKLGSTEVVGNEVKSDGFKLKDIEDGLSVENLQKYLETIETDHIKLWNDMLDKMEGKTLVVVDNFVVLKPIATEAPPKTNEKKKRGRPAKSK